VTRESGNLVNLGTVDPELRKKRSQNEFEEDIERELE
jgi:hypothetical protein